LGQRVADEQDGAVAPLNISFTPSLQGVLGHHQYAAAWAEGLVHRIVEHGLENRPIHIISANLHSIRNVLYGRGAVEKTGQAVPGNLYEMGHLIRDRDIDVAAYGADFGYIEHTDDSGSNIDAQIIDLAGLDLSCVHPSLQFDLDLIAQEKPIIVVIDYAFGTQAYEIMDELLSPTTVDNTQVA